MGHQTRWASRWGCLALTGALACSQEPQKAGEAENRTEEAAPPGEEASANTVELPPGDGPVARVNGVEIPREAFNRDYRQTLERYQRARHTVRPELRERLKDNIVRRLVDQEIIAQQAKEMGIALDPEVLQSKWTEHKKRYGSAEAFSAFLERAGTTAEDVRRNFDDNHLREAVFAKIGENVTVSGKEAREFFNENRQRYDDPESVRASHILIRVPPGASEEVIRAKQAVAKKVAKQARKKGASFEALALEYGEDPTKHKGGDLGFFPKGRMVKELEEAVWKLRKGQVSAVVRTSFGFHVVKKTDFKAAKRPKFEDVSTQIERALVAGKRTEAIRGALEQWKTEADLEVFVKGDPEIINAGYDRPQRASPLAAPPTTLEAPATPGARPARPEPSPSVQPR